MNKKIGEKEVILIGSGFFWLLVAHGMAMFNKYSYHDDVAAFNSVGRTFNLGRWMLGLLGYCTELLFGSKHYSLPIIHGLLSGICIVTLLGILVHVIRIESRCLIVLLCGIFISFPAVTCTFGFFFTSSYYFFGTLLAVSGAYVYYRQKTVASMLVCSVLMAASVGVYQANIPVCICSLLLVMIDDIYLNDYDWKFFWVDSLKNVAICIAFIAEYFIVNKLVLHYLNITLETYKGMNNFGATSVKGYVARIMRAYKQFIYPSDETMANMFHFNAKGIHIVLIGLVLICAVSLLSKIFAENKKKAIQLTILFLMFPLAAYFIYVMVDVSALSGLMMYGEAFTYLLAAWILERSNEGKANEVVRKMILIMIALALFFNIRFSNMCYIKQAITQSQTISYFTTLATQIKATEGYSDETPVVYIDEFNKNDESLIGSNYSFDSIQLTPYNMPMVINDYAWRDFMRQWVGFNPHIGDESLLDGNEEVINMPSYPDDGSIRNINGQIVVKFGE